MRHRVCLDENQALGYNESPETMFDLLAEKLDSILNRLRGKGRLSPEDVDEALRQVRLALLEADVNLKVARDFIASIRERALSAEVMESLTPGQQVVKVVNEALIELLGAGQAKLQMAPHPPSIYMLVGLQGSGKTTTVAKLGRHLRHQGQRPLLVAADVYRPAAIDQLVILGKQLDLPVYSDEASTPPLAICQGALAQARRTGVTCLILDTAGRLHIDEAMMEELAELKAALGPTELLLVVDAMTGQDAVRAASAFHQQLSLTGLILTKMDGDARGGAALSIKAVTGVPVKFIGTGEKADALEPFYPDRLASRLLGMGDVITLIERAEATMDQQRAQALERKLRRAEFTLEDFLEQLQQVKKMGPLTQLAEMIPGFSRMARQGRVPAGALDDRQLEKVEAIVYSMTPPERRRPDIIDGSRRRRIARGSGTTPQDVNQLLNQFRQMQQMVKALSSGKGRGLPRLW